MNVEQLQEELGDWTPEMRVTVHGDGDILSFEPDGHGGLRILCGDLDQPVDVDKHFYAEVEPGGDED